MNEMISRDDILRVFAMAVGYLIWQLIQSTKDEDDVDAIETITDMDDESLVTTVKTLTKTIESMNQHIELMQARMVEQARQGKINESDS